MSINRDSLFLTELIFDLFIFIICAVVCCGILVHANGVAVRATELTDAVYIAESLAERAAAGAATAGEYFFDAGGVAVAADGDYTAKCTVDGSILHVEVFGNAATPIYTLDAASPEVVR